MVEKISTLLLFGATGDLARRMLLPSLYGLDSDGLLPADLRIVGTARSDLDDSGFRGQAEQALKDHLPKGFFQQGVAERFLSRLHYVALDINEPEHLNLEMLVSHRERHHPLIKAGLAKNGLRIAVH